MKERFVGIDLGKQNASVCVLNSSGQIDKRMTIPVNRESLLQFSRSLEKESSLALEACSNSYAVSRILLGAGHEVTVSNPLATALPILEAIRCQEEIFEKELAKRAWENDRVKLLLTIPGVDFTSALSVVSSIGDPGRFKSPKKLCNYFGLVPSLYESGQTSHSGSITKMGNCLARWSLIQCANVAVKVDHPLQAFYQRIKRKKGHNVAVTAVARKLVVIMWHMLTKQEPYLFERPALTAKKLARLRILATGAKLKRGRKAEPGADLNFSQSLRKKKKEECLKNGLAHSGFPKRISARCATRAHITSSLFPTKE